MSRSDFILTYLLAVCTAGNFVCAGIHDHVISLRPPTVHVHQGYLNEDSVSVFSKIACLCLFPTFLERWNKQESSTPKIPLLRRGLRSKNLVGELTSRLTKG
ncbi:uncharacterized protein LOC142771257 [Rhipicephalus microplus]|uniref:uncharacterized protein LOC142771257 n=1 Tax=Rhipicephalus microplus TaxID=6941 RepID=UPI003F6A7BE4